MKILIFGDLYGRVGREALENELPALKSKYKPDFIIVNGENMTSGFGPILKHLTKIQKLGVDVITGGNHTLKNEKDIGEYLNSEQSIALRPANFYETSKFKISGKGYKIFEKSGQKLLVINLMSGVFMLDNVYNPFLKLDEILLEFKNVNLDGIVVDFHRETTSESQGMALLFDGKISFLFGTHTHVQTNDDTILHNGTGMITDVGFVGPRNSVIGLDLKSMEKTFMTGIVRGKKEQKVGGEYVVNGVFVELENFKCKKIEKIRIEK